MAKKTRLWKNTLEAEYGPGELTEYTLAGKCLLQKNFGEDYDCTLTSLAAIFGEEHYELIESFAKDYGYDGKKRGTNPLVVTSIMQRVMEALCIDGEAHGRYGKGIGFNWKTIGKLLGRGHRVVVNICCDGRGYYKNHSVLIVGVASYDYHRLLAVYDNWNNGVSYVDYDKLSVISSINWHE